MGIDDDRRKATAWAAQQLAALGWSLAADPYSPKGWEASKDGRCLVIEDWRDLCRLAREERDA